MPGLIVKKDVGLLDVDNTLVFQGNADTVIYNDNLLETLKKRGFAMFIYSAPCISTLQKLQIAKSLSIICKRRVLQCMALLPPMTFSG